MNGREAEVACLTRQGLSARQIAARLGVSMRTVARYRTSAGVAKPKPPLITEEQWATVQRLLDDGCSAEEAARTIGVTATPLRRRYPDVAWDKFQVSEHALLIKNINRKAS